MNKEHLYKLTHCFPSLFKYPVEISCGDGWYDMVYNLCTEIEKILAFKSYISGELRENFYVIQIKEKFAGLRFYTSVNDADIDKVIQKYEAESFHICEVCGDSNGSRKQSHGWIKTMCKKCATEQSYE
jgi:hypothetical protein